MVPLVRPHPDGAHNNIVEAGIPTDSETLRHFYKAAAVAELGLLARVNASKLKQSRAKPGRAVL
jgi:hypothetical protein